MKIQTTDKLYEERHVKLLRSSMLYIILFALGVVMYFKSTNNVSFLTTNIRQSDDSQSNGLGSINNTLSVDQIDELDKFATLKTEDQSNLPSCGTYVKAVNYNCPEGEHCTIDGNNRSPDPTCKSSDCKAKAEKGETSGWIRLVLCEDRPNKNIGCMSGSYTGAVVDTVWVQDFPLLNFLGSTQTANVDVKSTDPFKYTQPYCFYNMFRNGSSTSSTSNSTLAFGTNIKGPLYFTGNICTAAVPVEKLGTAAACWGINWDNFDDSISLDVKSFYPAYWDKPLTNKTSGGTPDSWWASILNFFNLSKISSNLRGSDQIKKVSDYFNDKKQVCESLPGGGIERFSEMATANVGKTYEVTRKVIEFSKKELCDNYFSQRTVVDGVEGCTVHDGPLTLTITNSNKYDRLPFMKMIYDPKTHVRTYCEERIICGKLLTCDSTYGDVYEACTGSGSSEAPLSLIHI